MVDVCLDLQRRVSRAHRRGVVRAVEGDRHGLHADDADGEIADGASSHRDQRIALRRRGAAVDVHQRLDFGRSLAAHLAHAEVVRT